MDTLGLGCGRSGQVRGRTIGKEASESDGDHLDEMASTCGFKHVSGLEVFLGGSAKACSWPAAGGSANGTETRKAKLTERELATRAVLKDVCVSTRFC